MESIIHNWLPSLVACGALGLVWAGFQSSRKAMQETVQKLQELISSIKEDTETSIKSIQKRIEKSLYEDSGITRYVPRSDCDRQANACQRAICMKIDEMKIALQKSDSDIKEQMFRMDDKREKTKENLRKDFEYLRGAVENLAGKFEQRQRDINNGKSNSNR